MKIALVLGVLALLVSASFQHEVAVARIESTLNHPGSGTLGGHASHGHPDPDPCPGCSATVYQPYVSWPVAPPPPHVLAELPVIEQTDPTEFVTGDCLFIDFSICLPAIPCTITGPGAIRWTSFVTHPDLRVTQFSSSNHNLPPGASVNFDIEAITGYPEYPDLYIGTKVAVWVDVMDLGLSDLECGTVYYAVITFEDVRTDQKYEVRLPFGCSGCPFE